MHTTKRITMATSYTIAYSKSYTIAEDRRDRALQANPAAKMPTASPQRLVVTALPPAHEDRLCSCHQGQEGSASRYGAAKQASERWRAWRACKATCHTRRCQSTNTCHKPSC